MYVDEDTTNQLRALGAIKRAQEIPTGLAKLWIDHAVEVASLTPPPPLIVEVEVAVRLRLTASSRGQA